MVVGARLKGIRLLPVLDTMAPGVLVAQAIGRWGNWFNQELFGRPTDLPWGLEIDVDAPPGGLRRPRRRSTRRSSTSACGASRRSRLIVWLDRRFRLGHGRVVALYVMAYTLGRGWIEMLRIDTVQLDDVARPALQRVDLDRAVRPRRGVVRLRRAPLAGAGDRPCTSRRTAAEPAVEACRLLKRRSPRPGEPL